MGDPLKAERTPKHFAAVVSPTLAATPFGQRMVPSVPAVSFAVSELVAERTYGNQANLFLERSVAIDSGKFFTPVEFLNDNPVEGGFSTSHGHLGTINGPAITPCTGAINCGVQPGPNAECSAEFAGLIDALAERLAGEFTNSPLSFLQNYSNAHDLAMADMIKEKGSGYWESIKGGASAVGGWASDSWDYLSENDIGTIATDAKEAATDAYDGAVAWTTDAFEAIAELSDLGFEDIKAIIKDWLMEQLDDMACSARDVLSNMLADPKPMAAQIGEAIGAAKVHVAESAAIVLVTRGAGGAASKMGQLLGKSSERIGDLYERLKVGAAKRREAKAPSAHDKPEGKPDGATPPAKPTKGSGDDDGNDGNGSKKDGLTGKEDGKAHPNCLGCSLEGKPVNAIYGVKLLEGPSDLDFVLEAPLPLAWQRTYVSSNAHVGWLGQGWSLPIAFRLETLPDGLAFIDLQGRRTRFPSLAVGERFFSKYEHTTLQRNQRNQYELIGPDGLRLIFGLGPREQANLQALQEQEAQREQREAQAWQHLLDSRHEDQPPCRHAPRATRASSRRKPAASACWG